MVMRTVLVPGNTDGEGEGEGTGNTDGGWEGGEGRERRGGE